MGKTSKPKEDKEQKGRNTMTYESILEVETSKHGDGGTLNIRNAASLKGKKVATAKNHDPIAVNRNSEANGWIAVNYDGCMGYAMSQFIKGTEAYGTTPSTGAGNYDGSNVDCKAKTTQSISLYTSADTSSAVRATIPSGKTIAVNSSLSPIAAWLRAVYNNKLGYVKHATLVVSKEPEYYGVKACCKYGEALLRQGMQNDHVRVFKRDLYDAGYHQLTLNNVFDADMKAAVMDFQAEKKIASDGIVGTDTKEKMYSLTNFG